jgi:hypothetical protein
MAYVPKFVTKQQIVTYAKHPKVTVANIDDETLETAEQRVIDDLEDGHWIIGRTISYLDLIGCNASKFSLMLKVAARYACLSELNSQGFGNVGIGPIVSGGGDGMSKIQSYYTGKATNNDVLGSAEEKYLNQIDKIAKAYNANCGSRDIRAKVYNEVYGETYNVNYADERKTEGNEI